MGTRDEIQLIVPSCAVQGFAAESGCSARVDSPRATKFSLDSFPTSPVGSFPISSFGSFPISSFASFFISSFASFSISSFGSFSISSFGSLSISSFGSFLISSFASFPLSSFASFPISLGSSCLISSLASSFPRSSLLFCLIGVYEALASENRALTLETSAALASAVHLRPTSPKYAKALISISRNWKESPSVIIQATKSSSVEK
mmetsp:Transcript_15265/g.31031  ORF Transcript_15265/g.31031 Transcript_15265/m.31031 type:complete len:205 (-) Transcript_15265:2063-2677(-)